MGYVKKADPVVSEQRSLTDLWARRMPIITEDAGYDPNRDKDNLSKESNVKNGINPLAYVVGPVVTTYGGDPAQSKVIDFAPYINLLASRNSGTDFLTYGTCYNFTTILPRQVVEPGQVKLTDMWAVMDSQETVGVSPELFHELIFPYYQDLAGMYGLVYWGCCEPVDPIWGNSISELPNLNKSRRAIELAREEIDRVYGPINGLVNNRKSV